MCLSENAVKNNKKNSGMNFSVALRRMKKKWKMKRGSHIQIHFTCFLCYSINNNGTTHFVPCTVSESPTSHSTKNFMSYSRWIWRHFLCFLSFFTCLVIDGMGNFTYKFSKMLPCDDLYILFIYLNMRVFD